MTSPDGYDDPEPDHGNITGRYHSSMDFGLWGNLERMCGIIKHDSESVELEDVRVLLRSAQSAVAVLDLFLSPERFSVSERVTDGMVEKVVSVDVVLDRDQLRDLYSYMAGEL